MTRWRKLVIKEPSVPKAQRSIFEIEHMNADDRAIEGMEQSYNNSPTEYKRAARERLQYLVQNRDEFTADDIVSHLNQIGIVGNHSALGAIIKGAARAGFIRPTDRFKKSVRPERHGQAVKVWKSNLSNGGSL